MPEPERFEDESATSTVFRDVLMLALLGFAAVVVLLLGHVNPPAKAEAEHVSPPGNVIVEIRWPDGLNADVDLWVQAPGDVPVGYSNKGGKIFNLLRDDLGRREDLTDLNYEVAYSRGIPPGEYTVNVHLYRNTAKIYPVTVEVAASVRPSPEADTRQIASTRIELERLDQEVTAFRFKLNEASRLVLGSVHDLQKPLRAAR